jgi:predicted nucleotidyltransferase
MSRVNIELPRDKIEGFCCGHHITRLSFFGSVWRDDFSPCSNVEVLGDMEPGHVPGLAFFD